MYDSRSLWNFVLFRYAFCRYTSYAAPKLGRYRVSVLLTDSKILKHEAAVISLEQKKRKQQLNSATAPSVLYDSEDGSCKWSVGDKRIGVAQNL